MPKLRTTNCERGKVVRSFYESLAKTFAILVVLLLDGLVEIWSYLAKTPTTRHITRDGCAMSQSITFGAID